MIAKDNDSGNFEPIPAGTQLGVCVGVIDLGTQHNYKFDKYERKCLISFELPDVRIEVEEDGETKDLPRFISRRFTLSLGSNAHLRKFLKSWRGRDFTPEELQGFKMQNILGQAANVLVLHEQSKDGTKTYSNIETATNLLKEQAKPQPESELVYFSFDDVESLREVDDATDDMPEWIQKLIQKSVEYNDLAKANAPTGPVEAGVGQELPEPDDDIPF